MQRYLALIALTFPAIAAADATLGNRVWNDLNSNGRQDAGEPGIPGVSVFLRYCNGTFNVDTATTDQNGIYLFTVTDVPTRYQLQFSIPVGMAATLQDVPGGEGGDSDIGPIGTTQCIYLNEEVTKKGWDAGFVDGSSEPPPPPPEELDEFIGDYLFEDKDQDGKQTSIDEPMGPGIKVDLLTCRDLNVVASTVSDANGNYFFANQPPGRYKVRFHTPEGFAITVRDAASRNKNSDPFPDTGITGCFLRAEGKNRPDIDAGFFRAEPPPSDMKRFGVVWLDQNGNNRRGAGEPGVRNIRVLFRRCGNSTQIVDEIRTDANGNFSFDVPRAEVEYRIHVKAPGYEFVNRNASGGTSHANRRGQTGCYRFDRGIEGPLGAGIRPVD